VILLLLVPLLPQVLLLILVGQLFLGQDTASRAPAAPPTPGAPGDSAAPGASTDSHAPGAAADSDVSHAPGAAVQHFKVTITLLTLLIDLTLLTFITFPNLKVSIYKKATQFSLSNCLIIKPVLIYYQVAAVNFNGINFLN